MTRSVAFVTTELPPTGSGGAGAVVARTRRLLEAQGHRVVVILVGPDEHPDAGVVVVPAPDDPLERSRLAAEAVADHARGFDLIEFQDFYGLGFAALERRAQYGLTNTTVAVRLHGPMTSILDAIGENPVGYQRYLAMERHAMAMADAVLVPSAPMAEYARATFGLDADRIVVAEPATAPDIARVPYAPAPEPELVLYGKLAEVKGTLLFAQAAAHLLDVNPTLRVRFVGGDGWSFAQDRSMTEIVGEALPVSDRVTFEPLGVGPEVGAVLGGAWLVVIPSLFETFCLAAHDVRASGFPLLVSDLAAFGPYFTEATGAAVFDGTALGLEAAVQALLGEPSRLQALAAAPPPGYGDPTAPYGGEMPPIRHPQSQAGLATIAAKEFEDTAPQTRTQTWAGRLLRGLPSPVATAAVKILPQALKDRFRGHANWPQEQARRARLERHDRTRRRAATEPAATAPEVSIVIPCFNQGDWLMDAIASVYEQHYDSWAIVVVDDGSTDQATVDTIDAVGEFPRVTVVRQQNRGLPAARNAGIRASGGPVIVPLDADDELTPGFLAEMTAALGSQPGAAFAHCWAELYGDVAEIWVTRPFNLYQLLMGNSIVGCVALRRQAWEAVGGYDETMTDGNEDWELWVRLLLAGWQQVAVRKPLFRYRRIGASMSARTEARFEQGRRQIVQRHRDAYATDALTTMKRGWYPAVSLLTIDAGIDAYGLADCEIIVIGDEADIALAEAARDHGWPLRMADDLDAAVASSRGKYVVGPGVEWSDSAALTKAVASMEETPDAFAIVDESGQPLLWRRWALVDAGSPHPTAVSGAELGRVVSPSGLGRGAHVDPEWAMPQGAEFEVPIHRQSPEVEGIVPTAL